MSPLTPVVCVLMLLTLALFALPEAGAGQASPPRNLNQYTIRDPYLQCTAWTFLAPSDWEIRGGVGWTGRLSPAYYTSLSVRNPRSSEEFSFFPTFSFADTRQPILAGGAEIRAQAGASACIREILIPRCRSGIGMVRIVSEERLPRVAAVAMDRAHSYGISGAQTDSARMLVEYTVNGRQMEEMFYCTTVSGRGMGVTFWVIDRAFSYRAEKGRLEAQFPLLGTISASMIENPEWVAARKRELNRLVAAMTPPPQMATGSGGPSILDVSKQMSRDNDAFIRNVDRSFSARLNSPGLNAWTDAQRGVTGMHNPVTGERVDVANGYQRYFQDGLGRVFGSNDVIGDPYVNYHINATELQAGR